MLRISGAPRRLPRSGLTYRWFSAACRDGLTSAVITAAILSAGSFLLNLAYSVWEPEKATGSLGWFIVPFVVGAVVGAFARRAPLTRGSLIAEIAGNIVGALVGLLVLAVLSQHGLITLV